LSRQSRSRRADVRECIWTFLEFVNAEDQPELRDIWERLGREFPSWGERGSVPPVVIDDLQLIVEILEPRVGADEGAQRESLNLLKQILREEHKSMATPDYITREIRDTRRLFSKKVRERRERLRALAALR
jgi:hypothetical protein